MSFPLSAAITPGGAFPVVDGGAQKIINLADPTNPQDAATKAYADRVVSAYVIFQPTGVSAFPIFGDQASLATFVNNYTSSSPPLPLSIIVDTSLVGGTTTVDSGMGTMNCAGLVSLVARSSDIIRMNDGAQFRNLAGISGVTLNCNPQTVASLLWDSGFQTTSKLFTVSRLGSVNLLATASITASTLVPFSGFGIVLDNATVTSAHASIATLHMSGATPLALHLINGSQVDTGVSPSTGGAFSGIGGTAINITFDSQVAQEELRNTGTFSFVNFAGTLGFTYAEFCSQIFYNDTRVAPTLGAGNVQDAIDQLKTSSSPYRRVTTTTSFTGRADFGIRIAAISGNMTITMPSSPVANERHAVKAMSGSVSSGFTIDVLAAGGQQVEKPGSLIGTYDSSARLTFDGQSLVYVWNSTDSRWEIE